MNFKKFTSENNWFTITLPEDWDEYDDDSDDTYAFFNSKSNVWKGNLRITPFRWRGTYSIVGKAAKLIETKFRENDGAIKIKLNGFDCAHYKKDLIRDNEVHVIYYWAIGSKDDFFMCSFTIGKEQENMEQNIIELEVVTNILKSIETT